MATSPSVPGVTREVLSQCSCAASAVREDLTRISLRSSGLCIFAAADGLAGFRRRVHIVCRMRGSALRGALTRHQDRAVRLSMFRNLDRADAVEQIGGDVVRHRLAKRRQRPLVVGAPHGNAERPRINRCAAARAHDDIELRLAVRAPAERSGRRTLSSPRAASCCAGARRTCR